MPRPERYAVTAEIVAAITSSRVLEEVLANVACRTAEALNVWECDIYEYHADEDVIVGQALWAREPHPADAEWLGSSQALADQPIHRRVLSEARIIASHIDDPELPEGDREGMEWWDEKSCLLVPLIFQDEVIGCLELVEKRRIRRFSTRECEFAATLAALAAVAIQNARLHGSLELLATTDGLTGLYNYRFFYERLTQEVARARRYNLPLSLLMIDIDDFKRYNDRFGHPAGDALLRELAALVLGQTRRRVDLVSRYGGEEFAVILPSTGSDRGEERAEGASAPAQDAPGAAGEGARALPDGGSGAARAAAERLRAAVGRESFGTAQEPPVVTISIGVATLPDHASAVDGLVAAADQALYRAKEKGKNRVEVVSPG